MNQQIQQSRRSFLRTLGLSAAALTAPLSVHRCSSAAKRPNIILILADDLGYNDLSCYGQTWFKTPHLDAMAEAGMRFTRHYAGAPVCAPSRCVLMTGLHTGHARVRGNRQAPPFGQMPLASSDVTSPQLLQRAGYRTGCFGKWGLGVHENSGDPQKQGFDTFYGYYDQVDAHNSWPEFLYKDGVKVQLKNKVNYLPEDHWTQGRGGYAEEKKEFSNDLILNQAMDFIESCQDQPFFLYFPTTLPHDNGEAPKGQQFEVPSLGAFENTDWTAEEKAYAAMVTRLDGYVGKIRTRLDALGIADNTLIVFTSDNGALPGFRFNSNAPFRGYKRDLYEGGIRVPMIACWPGKIRPGQVSGHVSAFQDYLPTLSEAAGIAYDGQTDGISFLPALLGENQKEHDFLYWEFHWWKPARQAVLMGSWKGVKNSPEAPVELYDLEKDPGESKELSIDFPEITARIEDIMKSSRDESDAWPLTS